MRSWGTVQDFEDMVAKNPSLRLCSGYRKLTSRLEEREKYALLILAGAFIERGDEPLEYGNGDILRNEFEALIRYGVAVAVPQEARTEDETSNNRILLSSAACRDLFLGHPEFARYDQLSRQAEVIRHANIIEKTLFFEEKDRALMGDLERMMDPETCDEIMDRLEKKGRSRGFSILLHGGPGLGKTELAKQLALGSGRDIFNVDTSRIYDVHWGDTEKNIRALFRHYRYMVAVSTNPPILLFNEADGILRQRGEDSSSVGHAMDTVQTIILQEMETFEGIFMATTNLAGSLDKAFARRFLFKVEFHPPGMEVRAKIWASLIPDLKRSEVMELAARYQFTGGQIQNVATKREFHEVLHGRLPDMFQMISFCEEERSLDKKSGQKIGFLH